MFLLADQISPQITVILDERVERIAFFEVAHRQSVTSEVYFPLMGNWRQRHPARQRIVLAMAWVAQCEYRVCTATLEVSLEDFDSGTTYLECLLGSEHSRRPVRVEKLFRHPHCNP